jgi:hypothetical protein
MKKNKTTLFLAFFIIIGIFYFVFIFFTMISPDCCYQPLRNYNLTYSDCVKNITSHQSYFPLASQEPPGAIRTDSEGNVWVKNSDGWWTSSSSQETALGDMMIDSFPFGHDLYLEEVNKCSYLKYPPKPY